MSKRGKIIVLVVANFILLLVTYWGVDCYVDNKADKLKDDAVAKLDSFFSKAPKLVRMFNMPYRLEFLDITDEECPDGTKTYMADAVYFDRKADSNIGRAFEFVRKPISYRDTIIEGVVERFVLFPTYINEKESNPSLNDYINSDLECFLREYPGYTNKDIIQDIKSQVDNEFYHIVSVNKAEDENRYERRTAEELENSGVYYRVFGAKSLFSTYSIQLRDEDVVRRVKLSKMWYVFSMLLIVELLIGLCVVAKCRR